jgi:flagellar hook-associated protein 1 FlgK
MSLIGALNVGQSALATAQAQIQTTGNNIANVQNPDYTREVATDTEAFDQQVSPGIFVGTGVDLTSVSRQIDTALQSRLQSATSDSSAASTASQWLGQVQSAYNALSGDDISANMTSFFSAWSNLANNPQDEGQRAVVLQDGAQLAQQFQGVRSALTTLGSNVNSQITSLAQQANSLAGEIANLNGQIVSAQGGTGGTANQLLDQRDADVTQLSQLMNVQTVQQPNGVVNVYVGSEPLVMNAQSMGITTAQSTTNGTTTQGLPVTSLVFQNNGGNMNVTSGQLGALMSVQQQINSNIDQVDTLAHNVINQVNQIHSSGQGLEGVTSVTATNSVSDATAALDSTQAGLKYTPVNGSFVIHVTQGSSGLDTSTLVKVSLGSSGSTSLNDLAASLNAISGVSATVTDGKLTISSTDPDATISFSQDSSGVLADLGINTFFTGSDASNIAMNQTLTGQPDLLAAAQNGDPDDNSNALALANLENSSVPELGGSSLQQNYQSIINNIGASTANAQTNATATQDVTDTLQSQQSSLSGVSLDEETMNLMQQQQAYQGAARLITTISAMMQTLIAM